MSTDKNPEEFYTKLKGRLEETTTSWPADYLYKFIVPSDNQKIAEIKKLIQFWLLHIKSTKPEIIIKPERGIINMLSI